MKKFKSVAAVGVAAGVFALASCVGKTDPAPTTTTEQKHEKTSAEKLLDNLIFEADGTVVTGNLELASALVSGKETVSIKWTSDSDLVKIATTIETGKDFYVATVSRPADETKTVTIKAEIEFENNKASKEFHVTINPYDCTDAVNAFIKQFKQNGATVYEDFDLASEFEFGGSKATITWSVPTNAADMLKIEDGKCKVTQQQDKVKTSISATITYKGETQTRRCQIFVWRERTPLELLHAFYDNVGDESYTLKGYVVAKAGYDASYKNGYLYIADQSLQGGYYIYRVTCETQALWDELTIGTAVEIPQCKSTDYNGLIEVGQNKECVVAKNTTLPALTTEQLATITNGFAADELFMAEGFGVNHELKYYTGTRVKLTSWKVKEINATASAAAESTFATLEKGGIEVQVVLSKYGTDLNSDAAKKAADELKTLKVGDYVDVKGILSCDTKNKGGYFVEISDADKTFTKRTASDDNASIGIYKDLVAATDAALAKFPETITDPFTLDKSTIALADGVTLAVEVDNTEIATWAGNVLTVNPAATAVTLNVTVKATKGDVTISKKVSIYTKLMTAQQKADAEKEAFKLEIDEFGEYNLQATGATFGDIDITYALKEATAYATLVGNKLTVLSVDDDTTITLVVTFKKGTEATATKEVALTIKNKSRTEVKSIIAPENDKEYYFALYQSRKGEWYYAKGDMVNTKYIDTTTKMAEASKVKVETTATGVKIKFADGKYVHLTDAGALEKSTTATEWTYDTDKKCWKAAAGTPAVDYFIGTYNDNTTMGASKTSYLPGTGNQYISNFVEINELTKTREEKIAYEFEAVAATLPAEVDSGASITLPTTGTLFEDVKAEFKAKTTDDAELADISGGTITFKEVTVKTRVNFTVEFVCGGEKRSENFYFEILPLEFDDVTTATKGKDGDKVYVTGVVTKVYNNVTEPAKSYAMITDGTNQFEVYGKLVDNSEVSYGQLVVGDTICASGLLTTYGDLKETTGGSGRIHARTAGTDETIALAKKFIVDTTIDELAGFPDFNDSLTKILAVKGSTYPDAAITWSTPVASNAVEVGSSGTYTTLVIKQGTTDDATATLRATVTYDGKTETKDFEVKVNKKAATRTIIASYAVGSGTTLDVLHFGLNDNFTIAQNKNSATSNTQGNAGGHVRLYSATSGDGGQLQIGTVAGCTINTVKISFTSDSSKDYKVYAANGTTELTATDGVYTVDGTGFIIKNVGTANQVRVTGFEINYTVTEE